MHTVIQYNVSEVVRQCFWGRGTEKYGQRVVSAHSWVMMRTTLSFGISVIQTFELIQTKEPVAGVVKSTQSTCVDQ